MADATLAVSPLRRRIGYSRRAVHLQYTPAQLENETIPGRSE